MSWRALALFLAVVLWFVATERSQRNIGLEVRHVPVDLHYVNIGEDLEVASAPSTVDVTVEGPRLILPFQIRDVNAEVDLNQLGPGSHNVPVRVELPSTVTLQSYQPNDVHVVLEQRVRQRLPVTVSVVGVPPGVMVHVVETRPDEADVYGASSAVAAVSTLLARVDVGRRKSQAVLVPVDAHGELVSGVMLSTDTVEVILETVENPSRPTNDSQLSEEMQPTQENDLL